jgi:heme oxygenase (biliverdin-producing, ferredoxin)
LSIRLAERLKSETRALHTAAERSSFMAMLMRGEMRPAAYCALLRNLHALYAALEPALERHATHPSIAPVCLPALWRTRAIEHDLQLLHGSGWAQALPLQAAMGLYCERLVELDAHRPGLLLAHVYVRYLGELSGGQMLRRVVAALGEGQGSHATAFYEFGDPVQTRALTQALRDGVTAVVVDAADEDALVDEARRAFELHLRLFDELALADGA